MSAPIPPVLIAVRGGRALVNNGAMSLVRFEDLDADDIDDDAEVTFDDADFDAADAAAKVALSAPDMLAALKLIAEFKTTAERDSPRNLAGANTVIDMCIVGARVALADVMKPASGITADPESEPEGMAP